jgi:hypothetical protein
MSRAAIVDLPLVAGAMPLGAWPNRLACRKGMPSTVIVLPTGLRTIDN